METASPSPDSPLSCSRCGKPKDLCVCDSLQTTETKTHILILQHPQEPDKDLGSAELAHLQLPNSTLKVGLSWPNLKAALGRETQATRWAVLYLGSGVKQGEGANSANSPAGRSPVSTGPRSGGLPAQGTLQFVSKKGAPMPPPKEGLEGVVVLDGTWSQAKALWWRNAWLLKLKRVILTPAHPSLYKELRKEPRRECLSTIESVAEVLDSLEETRIAGRQLRASFQALLDKQRARLKARKGPRR